MSILRKCIVAAHGLTATKQQFGCSASAGRLLAVAQRQLHSSPSVCGFGSNMSDNDPEFLEKAKHKSLHENKAGRWDPSTPGWNEKLASDSEAVVKAERHDDDDIEKLQKHTVEVIREEHHADDSEVEYVTHKKSA